ncbi:MAG: 1,2-phenylacetyl-CoA epoxidase subunit PaaC [Chloroflexota bacterium]
MNESLKTALVAKLTALADDELILAHRDSEWTGHAPILEEDIALANIAQDELGHATLFYELLRDITGDDPDQMAFFRDAGSFRNVQLVELPKGDWAFTMLRQYLFDAYECLLLSMLSDSLYTPLADAAAKIRQEELYHLRHTHLWVERLGLGTEESHRRMQDALNTLWPSCHQLFVLSAEDEVLIEANYTPDLTVLQTSWEEMVLPHLSACNLTTPSDTPPVQDDRTSHTEHLTELLGDMQQVARWDPEGDW